LALDTYRKKRDFKRTPEPAGGQAGRRAQSLSFCVQKHAARRLHYDFRLELDGVLKSWAVPKGPSFDPTEKRLAVHVEDHPLEYGGFEGTIPAGEYGAGTVVLWDRGRWIPKEDPHEGYRKGKLKFDLVGEKLRGGWTLARMGGRSGEGGKNWLLLKERDATARALSEGDVLDERPESVAGGPALDDAPRATLPARLEPQLATLASDPPTGPDWVHEIKWDGYRALCRIEDGRARLFSRSGKDWTREMAGVARAAETLPVENAWLDGEVVVLQADGRTSFQALQNALKGDGSARLTYFVFDLPFLDGRDLRPLPLLARKRELEALLARAGGATDVLRYGEHVEADGHAFFREATRLGVEGIVSKHRDSKYEGRRTTTWRKIRTQKRQEFVIGGFTDPAGSRIGLGALLLGVHEGGGLRYVGRVGTGFDDRLLRDLYARLSKLEQKTSPFTVAVVKPPRKSRFVRPVLVGEVGFTEWTDEGQLRHPVFLGLREDKPASDVVRERPAALPSKGGDPGVAGVRLTHPDRVFWPEVGVTKLELARYYESIAPRMLPHVAERPLSLLRAPQGHTGETFFHKHVDKGWPAALRRVEIREGGKTVTYVTVLDAAGLVGLAQMGVLEIHPWGSRAADVEKPDVLIFDLDPGPDVGWRRLVEAAAHTRLYLHELGFTAFVKTTGGKGLHVVVPIVPRAEWDEAKAFTERVAVELARRDPQLFVAVMSKAARPGKVFVDYLRNGRSQTAVAVFSTRARPGAPVSTPLRWDELLAEEAADRWTVRNLARRLASLKDDPWEGFFDVRQGIPETEAPARAASGGAAKARSRRR
jgi:bifunctional non-homologous end joining protein LigD